MNLAHLFRCGLTLISPQLNTKVCYRIKFKKNLDLKNPTTLNEKILFLKLRDYETNALVRQCADKYLVREYIKSCGCDDILVPLIAAYDEPKQIQWESLPNKFVLKWNFGCGFNIVCNNKSNLSQAMVVQQMTKWGKVKYHLAYSEMQYKGVPKKIIVEKYLEPKEGKLPEDYKLYCFNGIPKYCMLCVGREKGHPKYLYFDREFNFMRNFSNDGMKMPPDFCIAKPAGYELLFKYAEILSKPFAFVRSDFYLVDGCVYFGELTFTPGGAMDQGRVAETDKLFGDLVNLEDIKI